jgi:phage-related protein
MRLGKREPPWQVNEFHMWHDTLKIFRWKKPEQVIREVNLLHCAHCSSSKGKSNR